MGKYHPHGDSSIYDALVHMTEEYSLNLPLVDGHGNFGSIDGDGAAAMRYTEARLSPAARTMLDNLEKVWLSLTRTLTKVKKRATGSSCYGAKPFDQWNDRNRRRHGDQHPDTQSGRSDRCRNCVYGPSGNFRAEIDGLYSGTGFPDGGIITNASELANIYETGEGKIKVRAKTVIEKGDNGRTNIVITEIPYTVSGNKTKLVESISGLMKDKVFDEIYDVQDVSSKEGIRIVIEVKKDRDVQNLLNGLYKKHRWKTRTG